MVLRQTECSCTLTFHLSVRQYWDSVRGSKFQHPFHYGLFTLCQKDTQQHNEKLLGLQETTYSCWWKHCCAESMGASIQLGQYKFTRQGNTSILMVHRKWGSYGRGSPFTDIPHFLMAYQSALGWNGCKVGGAIQLVEQTGKFNSRTLDILLRKMTKES